MLSRLRAVTDPKAIAAGVGGTYTALFVLALFLSSGGTAGSVAGLVVLPLSPVAGGFIAGYVAAGTREKRLMNALFAGFIAGFLLGTVVALLFVVGTRVEPAPETRSVAELLFTLVVLPGGVGVGTAQVFGGGSLLGGWLLSRLAD